MSKSLTRGDLTSERPAGKHHLTALTILISNRRHARAEIFCNPSPVTKRTKLLLTGFIPILAITLIVIGIFALGALPGFAGEFFRKISGIMFTPFFLELSFAFLGVVAVLWINQIRLAKEGSEYVSLEINDDEIDPNTKK